MREIPQKIKIVAKEPQQGLSACLSPHGLEREGRVAKARPLPKKIFAFFKPFCRAHVSILIKVSKYMEDEVKRLARIMKALSNENRLSLYLQIYKQQKMAIDKQECFVSHIAHHLNIGAPTVSHHIKELENAGLIVLSKVGKQVTASVNPSMHMLVENVLLSPEKLG